MLGWSSLLIHVWYGVLRFLLDLFSVNIFGCFVVCVPICLFGVSTCILWLGSRRDYDWLVGLAAAGNSCSTGAIFSNLFQWSPALDGTVYSGFE